MSSGCDGEKENLPTSIQSGIKLKWLSFGFRSPSDYEANEARKAVWCKKEKQDKPEVLSSVFSKPLILLIFNFTCKDLLVWCWYRAYLKLIKRSINGRSLHYIKRRYTRFYEFDRGDWIYQISHRIQDGPLDARCAATVKWFMLHIMNFLCSSIDVERRQKKSGYFKKRFLPIVSRVVNLRRAEKATAKQHR